MGNVLEVIKKEKEKQYNKLIKIIDTLTSQKEFKGVCIKLWLDQPYLTKLRKQKDTIKLVTINKYLTKLSNYENKGKDNT